MLLTGNKKEGFSFIEVMVALVVLSAGIVLVYKTFFLCVDYLNNLTARVYAAHLIDSRIAEINRSLLMSADGALDVGPLTETVPINRRDVVYHFDIHLAPLSEVEGLYQLDINLNWFDGRRSMHEARGAYLIK